MSNDARVNYLIDQKMSGAEKQIAVLESRIKALEEEAKILHEEIHSVVQNMSPPKSPAAKGMASVREAIDKPVRKTAR